MAHAGSYLQASDGNLFLQGTASGDTLAGATGGITWMQAGSGNETLVGGNSTGNVTMQLGSGSDHVVLDNGAFQITTGIGNAMILAGGGQDAISIAAGGGVVQLAPSAHGHARPTAHQPVRRRLDYSCPSAACRHERPVRLRRASPSAVNAAEGTATAAPCCSAASQESRHGRLKGRRIAILATDGVEEVERTKPLEALKQASAEVTLVSLNFGKIQAMEKDVNAADTYAVDLVVAEAEPEQFDGLVLPGGTTDPDKFRMDKQAVAFVRAFVDAGKPIAAICHGPWMLIEVGAVDGRKLTSWPSLQTDLRNAGATWVDETVVRDTKLVTSRNPNDLPAFCTAIVELFAA